MRRFLTPVPIVAGLLAVAVGVPVGPALALPAQDPAPGGQPGAVPGKQVCEITDERLRELSGLIATADGYIVVNDGTDIDRNERIFYLDSSCDVDDTVRYPTRPLDPEDLALSPDGQTLWIADIGDNPTNDERRERVALWSMPVDGSAQPEIHRVSYPDGPHDAEALLIANDGTPLLITKSTGPAGIYRPVEQLRSNNDDPVPMEKVGELELPTTDTPNLFAAAGRLTVTGAARSLDGTRFAVRTYADAFEWDVPADGDLVTVMTTEEPRITPLTDAFGEAIAYSPDGAQFVTVSDVATLEEETPVEILRYPRSTEVAVPPQDAAGGDTSDGPSFLNRITLQDINYLIATVGLLGAILVGVGIYGIVRARRVIRGQSTGGGLDRKRADRLSDDDERAAERAGFDSGAASAGFDSDRLGSGALPPGPPVVAGRPVGPVGPPTKKSGVYRAAAPKAGVYGAATPPGTAYGAAKPAAGGSGAVYGAPPAAAPPPAAPPSGKDGVYGGPADSGAVYGAAKPATARPTAGVYGGRPVGDAGGDYPSAGYPADRYDAPADGGQRPSAGRDPHGGGAGVYGRPATDQTDRRDRRG
ncbi:hypothetical protein O7632_23605 [Solwaraspora sp. WMMD406]|uniref:hypothetical protein n=1 Tax=Solwaraspora sp. WMMD406 TaxID=3016095 RepID=UPI0024169B5A|nr:hypothetical protein [Solwaraspora sp. WMMD406]MDG4767060.1 hypothetical protein [Solwaraspora sp. WMMD406]